MIEKIFATDYLQLNNFLVLFSILSGIIFVRYIILSAAFHYYFRIFMKSVLGSRKLFNASLNPSQAKKEVYYSFISSILFGFVSVLMIIGWQKGIVKMYTSADLTYSWWYIPISIIIILLLHDTYYYWLHRLFHKRSVYKSVHKVHHESIETSAFTSFSFHPFESLFQAVIIPVLMLFIPLHVYAFIGLLIFMTISAVINHLGVEIYPSGIFGNWFAKWFIGATHHDHHHRNFRVNYGLYFTFWDRMMGTEIADMRDYHKRLVKKSAKI